ncbi:MAG: hypothetical protein AAF004_10990 [Pseudomonadota bacterium]
MFETTRGERYTWQFAALIVAFLPMTVAALVVDTRVVNDINVWIKPLKFEGSLALHLLTLAILIRLMPFSKRNARWITIVLAVICVACFSEILLITFQSMRGVASHFNTQELFDDTIYALMGIGALLLTLPVIAIGVRFATLPVSAELTPGLKTGATLGLILGAIATLLVAGYMSMQPTGHWVGGVATDIGGLPVTGWSRNGGDLRVPHFIATHLMQIVPFAGWIADQRCPPDSVWPRRIAWLTASIGTAAVVWTFIQARAGQPLL